MKKLLLAFLIFVGCGDDSSVNAGRCPTKTYVNYEVTYPLTCAGCDSNIEVIRHYTMQPFYENDIERMEPFIAEDWLFTEVKNGRNPFYTHCESMELYQRCIDVDTLYIETCE